MKTYQLNYFLYSMLSLASLRAGAQDTSPTASGAFLTTHAVEHPANLLPSEDADDPFVYREPTSRFMGRLSRRTGYEPTGGEDPDALKTKGLMYLQVGVVESLALHLDDIEQIQLAQHMLDEFKALPHNRSHIRALANIDRTLSNWIEHKRAGEWPAPTPLTLEGCLRVFWDKFPFWFGFGVLFGFIGIISTLRAIFGSSAKGREPVRPDYPSNGSGHLPVAPLQATHSYVEPSSYTNSGNTPVSSLNDTLFAGYDQPGSLLTGVPSVPLGSELFVDAPERTESGTDVGVSEENLWDFAEFDPQPLALVNKELRAAQTTSSKSDSTITVEEWRVMGYEAARMAILEGVNSYPEFVLSYHPVRDIISQFVDDRFRETGYEPVLYMTLYGKFKKVLDQLVKENAIKCRKSKHFHSYQFSASKNRNHYEATKKPTNYRVAHTPWDGSSIAQPPLF